MENKKSNKGLIIALIIINVILFFALVVSAVRYTLLKYTCSISRNINTTIDNGGKIVDKVFDIITKELDSGEKVPFINFDSQDASDINSDIEDFYNTMNSNGEASFKTYSNGDIQSIVIKYELPGPNYRYKVFNINKKTGKKVTAEELMNSKNISLSSIKIRMKAIWMQKVKKSEGYSMPTNSNPNISVENATKENIDKLTNDNIVLYLDSEGHLCVIYEEYQIAGSETGYYIMDLDKYLYTELK